MGHNKNWKKARTKSKAAMKCRGSEIYDDELI